MDADSLAGETSPVTDAASRTGNYGTISEPSDILPAESLETQDGVRAIEAVSMAWTKWSLIIAYCGLFLMAFTTSLEGQVTYSLSTFAVSSFKKHSLLSTVYVVQGVVNAVIKPPMAKVADVFGRLEAFSISILFLVLGYIQVSLSRNVQTYASAQIFYAAGVTGLQILQQIFVADTSSLPNRALLSSIPNTPFLVTVWIGPVIGSAILERTSWRWGYAMWVIILPFAFLPLALTLYINGRKASRLGLMTKKRRSAKGLAGLKKLFFDLDMVGILLLSAGFSLILIPLTLASTAAGGWRNHSILSMMFMGSMLLASFPVWESKPDLAPHPLIPLGLLKSVTFCAGCGIGFFFFMAFYLSIQPYFYSYLLVVHDLPVATAGQITQCFSFAATVTAIVVSLAMKSTRRFKPFLVCGSLVYLVGIGLMLQFRRQGASVATLAAVQISVGVGGGLINVPAQLGVQAACGSHSHVAAATAVFLTLVEIGGAVGAAISGAVWGNLVPNKLRMYLPEGAKDHAQEIYSSVKVARSYAWGSAEREAINRSYQETMTSLLGIAMCVAIPVVMLSLLMQDYRLDARNQGVKGRVIGGEVTRGEDKPDTGASAPAGNGIFEDDETR